MGINEACFHLANGQIMKVEEETIRLIGGFYQRYSKKEEKWLFLEENSIHPYNDAEWVVVL